LHSVLKRLNEEISASIIKSALLKPGLVPRSLAVFCSEFKAFFVDVTPYQQKKSVYIKENARGCN